MTNHRAPAFLDGTFFWMEHGFFAAGPPPIDLLSPAALNSDLAWVRVAAIIERAKRGDHSLIPRLREWYEDDRNRLDRVCIVLTGAVGRKSDVVGLLDLLDRGSDPAGSFAADAAASAGYLWLVPAMLEAWRRVTSLAHHETIGFAIAELLEAPGGPIARAARGYNISPEMIAATQDPELRKLYEELAAEQESPTEFEVLVEARVAELRAQFGSDQVPVWEGELWDVRNFAEKTLQLIVGDESKRKSVTFIVHRRKFEGATGIDCRPFFRNTNFQPLEAVAILEDFLESPDAARYVPGVRYFFGHSIPD
jgi:hypothetical protein